MKRTLLAICLCLLVVSPCLAQEQLAWMGPTAIVGGGVTAAAAECTTSNDSEIFTTANSGTESLGGDWACTKVTFSGTSTITEVKMDACTYAGSDLTFAFYTDNSNVPGTVIEGTSKTITITQACDTFANVTGTLTTPKASVNTPCWVCIQQTDGATYGFKIKYNGESGKRVTYGATRTSSPTDDFSLAIDVMGCTP
jgi:hypothetical protein